MNLSKQPRVWLNFVRYSMSRSTKTWSLYSVHCILTTEWPIASSGDVSTQRKKMSPCFQYVGKNLDGKQNSKQSVNDHVVSIEIFYNILLLPPKHCFRKVEKKKPNILFSYYKARVQLLSLNTFKVDCEQQITSSRLVCKTWMHVQHAHGARDKLGEGVKFHYSWLTEYCFYLSSNWMKTQVKFPSNA